MKTLKNLKQRFYLRGGGRILFCLIFTLYFVTLKAQDNGCGTAPTPDSILSSMPWYGRNEVLDSLILAGESKRISNIPATARGGNSGGCTDIDAPIFIPIHFFTILQEGQSSLSFRNYQIAMDNLNNFYQSNGIPFRFYYCNTDLTVGPFLSTIDSWWEAYFGLYKTLHSYEVINIYLVDAIVGANGVYYPPPGGDFICVRKSAITAPTLAHEIGHFLGLDHPHRNVDHPDFCQREVVSRTMLNNPLLCGFLKWGKVCSTNGDALCDTPADPNCDHNCPTIAATDYLGATFTPDVTNIMSYYSPRSTFTNGQKGVMYYDITHRHRELIEIDGDYLNPDKYEPDGDASTAREIKIGEKQCHSMNEYNCADLIDYLFIGDVEILGTLYIKASSVPGYGFPVSTINFYKRNSDKSRGDALTPTQIPSQSGELEYKFECNELTNTYGIYIEIRRFNNPEGKYTIEVFRSQPPKIENNGKDCIELGDQLSITGIPANSTITWSTTGFSVNNYHSNPTTISFIFGAPFKATVYINSGGCTETIVREFTEPNSPPPPFSIYEEEKPCYNSTTGFKPGRYSTIPPTNVEWSCNHGFVSPMYGEETHVTPSQKGFMTITATYNNECSQSRTVQFNTYVKDCSKGEERIQVSPNPNNGTFYVSMSDPPSLTNSTITLTDQYNVVRYQQQTNDVGNFINAALTPGIYVLNWTGDGFNFSQLISVSY